MSDVQARDYLMVSDDQMPETHRLYLRGRHLGTYKSNMDADYDFQPANGIEIAEFRSHLVWFALARNSQQPLQPLTD